MTPRILGLAVVAGAGLLLAGFLQAPEQPSQPPAQAPAQPTSQPGQFEKGGETLQSTDQFQARKGPVFDVETHPGKALFAENCATCHLGGVAKSPHKSWLEMMAPDAILDSMTKGIMRQQSAHLSRAQKVQITEYLMRTSLADYRPPAEPVACRGPAARFDLTQAPAPVGWGHDPRRFIPANVAGLPKDHVPQLQLKWAYAFPGAVRARSQPTIAMGAIFVGSQSGRVYAFDLETGCARWTKRASAEVRTGIVLDTWAPGTTPKARPRAYFGDLLGRVYAVDALSGRTLWSARMDDHPNATITATPTLHNGTLYVAVSSLEVTAAADPAYPCCTFRGSVVALDAATGRVKWKTYSIPEAPAQRSPTRVGTAQFGPSGAPFWNAPMIDAARNRLYVGSGENYSSPADANSNAVFALDLGTGKRLWSTQTLANDAWNVACMMADNPNCPVENGPDLDYSASPLLIQLSPGRDILVAGQKTGMAYGMDPGTGRILWQQRVGRGSTQGGIHFGMAAEGTRVYVPVNDMNDTRDGRKYPGPALAGLHAVDAGTGAILWRNVTADVCDRLNPEMRQYCDPGISAVVTAIPGVVFAGHLDGIMRAYDGATGQVIWQTDTTRTVRAINGVDAHGGGFSGPGVAVGRGHVVFNSGYGLYFHMPGNLLMVYAPKEG